MPGERNFGEVAGARGNFERKGAYLGLIGVLQRPLPVTAARPVEMLKCHCDTIFYTLVSKTLTERRGLMGLNELENQSSTTERTGRDRLPSDSMGGR